MFKKIFVIIIFFTLLLPSVSLATGDIGSKVPSFNPLCWHPGDCTKQGGSFFETTSGPCKTKKVKGKVESNAWGKCLPAGKTKTAISIGGEQVFTHVGEYILVVYNYVVAVAGILAVAVIIVAGLQWLTSGGNSDIITRSKKRIGGAFIGLAIAYTSYFVLGSINPAFIEMRMPQVWMVRPASIVPDKCADLPDKNKLLAYAAPYTDQKSKITGASKKSFDYSYGNSGAKYFFGKDKASKDKFFCGHRFFIEGGGEATCFADFCPNEDACVPFAEKENPPKPDQIYVCKKSAIGGTITYSGNKTKNTDWVLPHITNENDHELWGLCKEGTMKKVEGKAESSTNKSAKNQGWNFVATHNDVDKVVKFCKTKGSGFMGFVVMMPMDESGDTTDEDHWLGVDPTKTSKLGNLQARDLGPGSIFNQFALFFEIHPQTGIHMLAHRKKVKSTDLSGIKALADYVDDNDLKYWDARVDPKYFIDPKGTQLGKGKLIKLDINADYILDVDAGSYKKKDYQDHYAAVLQKPYQKLFKDKEGHLPTVTNYPTL